MELCMEYRKWILSKVKIERCLDDPDYSRITFPPGHPELNGPRPVVEPSGAFDRLIRRFNNRDRQQPQRSSGYNTASTITSDMLRPPTGSAQWILQTNPQVTRAEFDREYQSTWLRDGIIEPDRNMRILRLDENDRWVLADE